MASDYSRSAQEDYGEKSRRIQQLLSSYYGANEAAGTDAAPFSVMTRPSLGSVTPSVASSLPHSELNASQFDVDSFVDKSLRCSKLRDLLLLYTDMAT